MSNNPHAKKITISLKLICTIIPFMALAIIFLDKAETPPQEPKLLLYDDQLMMFYPI